MHLVRCSAHTLALAVDDCIGRKSDETTEKLLANARNVVCTLRNSNMRKELRKKFLPMAIIDVETRWSSTYDRDVQEPESESSKFFRSRIGLGVKFNVKTGVGVGAGVIISLSYYCNVH